VRLRIEAANAAVAVAGGLIVPSAEPYDAVIRIPGGELRPGLINAHDHLHRNHYGRLGRPPYASAYDWGRDIHRHDAHAIQRARALPRRDALLRGAWKNLFAGVTTVVHHDGWEPAFDRGFPIRVAPIRHGHSLGFEPDLSALAAGTGPFCIHLAEGVDDESAGEVRALGALGLLTPDLLAVHVVGPGADGVARLRASGAAVVWCPTSNLFLFGRTAPAELLAPGIDVLVGSDSLLTGDGSLLDELRVARGLGLVSDERLMDAVGPLAARRLGLARPTLDVGAPADLAVFRRPVLESSAHDVALTLVGGVPRVADPALVPGLGRIGDLGREMEMDGVRRWVFGGAAD
jgi:hypothetical protein